MMFLNPLMWSLAVFLFSLKNGMECSAALRLLSGVWWVVAVVYWLLKRIDSRIVVLVLLGSASAFGEIIPTDRRITWQGNVGVPGGIPHRTTVFASATDAPYSAVGDGVNDDTAELQALLDACPSNQVAYIPSGNYKITSRLTIKNGYTVRGAGTSTVIVATNMSTDQVFRFSTETNYEFPWYPTPSIERDVTAGYEKGSTTVTLNSVAGFSVGDYFMIDTLNDTNFVSATGNEGTAGWNSRGEGARSLKQIVEITAINGSDVTFTPPLFLSYTNTPKAIPFAMTRKYAGIEDLKLSVMNDGSSDANFEMWGAAYCWLKNIESDYADGDHVNMANSFRCEIRDSYFHDGFSHGPGSTDDTIKLIAGTTGTLIENNILRRMHVGIMMWGGGGGHVFGYNYMTNQFSSSCATCVAIDIDYHGAHPVAVLVEGNILNCFMQDGVWGTASHGTLLRNFITGQNYGNGPTSGRSAEDSSWTKQYVAARAINLAGYGNSKYFNIVGNRLGVSTMGNYPSFNPVYMQSWPTNRNWDHEGSLISLGFANGSDDGDNPNDNTHPYDTLLNHGNWDVVSGGLRWDAGIADQDIPTSYYLTEKPDFFGALEWPNSTLYSSTMIVTNQPAAHRWLVGDVPEESGGSSGGGNVNVTELRIGTIQVAP